MRLRGVTTDLRSLSLSLQDVQGPSEPHLRQYFRTRKPLDYPEQADLVIKATEDIKQTQVLEQNGYQRRADDSPVLRKIVGIAAAEFEAASLLKTRSKEFNQ